MKTIVRFVGFLLVLGGLCGTIWSIIGLPMSGPQFGGGAQSVSTGAYVTSPLPGNYNDLSPEVRALILEGELIRRAAAPNGPNAEMYAHLSYGMQLHGVTPDSLESLEQLFTAIAQGQVSEVDFANRYQAVFGQAPQKLKPAVTTRTFALDASAYEQLLKDLDTINEGTYRLEISGLPGFNLEPLQLDVIVTTGGVYLKLPPTQTALNEDVDTSGISPGFTLGGLGLGLLLVVLSYTRPSSRSFAVSPN